MHCFHRSVTRYPLVPPLMPRYRAPTASVTCRELPGDYLPQQLRFAWERRPNDQAAEDELLHWQREEYEQRLVPSSPPRAGAAAARPTRFQAAGDDIAQWEQHHYQKRSPSCSPRPSTASRLEHFASRAGCAASPGGETCASTKKSEMWSSPSRATKSVQWSPVSVNRRVPSNRIAPPQAQLPSPPPRVIDPSTLPPPRPRLAQGRLPMYRPPADVARHPSVRVGRPVIPYQYTIENDAANALERQARLIAGFENGVLPAKFTKPAVVLLVEMAYSTRAAHENLSLSHDPTLYHAAYEKLRAQIGKTFVDEESVDASLSDAGIALDVYVGQVQSFEDRTAAGGGAPPRLHDRDGELDSSMPFKCNGSSRLGAFEVYLVCLNLPDVEPTSRIVHSKLFSRKWPSTMLIRERCLATLRPAFERMVATDTLKRAIGVMVEADQVEGAITRYGAVCDQQMVDVAEARLRAMQAADHQLRLAKARRVEYMEELRLVIDEHKDAASESMVIALEEAYEGAVAAQKGLKHANSEMDEELLVAAMAEAERWRVEGFHLHVAQQKLEEVRINDKWLAEQVTLPAEAAMLRAAIDEKRERSSYKVVEAATHALAAIEAADEQLWALANADPFQPDELRVALQKLADKASGSVLKELSLHVSPMAVANTQLQRLMAHGNAAALEAAIKREASVASSSVLAEARKRAQQLRADEALQRLLEHAGVEAAELRDTIERSKLHASRDALIAAERKMRDVEAADVDVKRAVKGAKAKEATEGVIAAAIELKAVLDPLRSRVSRSVLDGATTYLAQAEVGAMVEARELEKQEAERLLREQEQQMLERQEEQQAAAQAKGGKTAKPDDAKAEEEKARRRRSRAAACEAAQAELDLLLSNRPPISFQKASLIRGSSSDSVFDEIAEVMRRHRSVGLRIRAEVSKASDHFVDVIATDSGVVLSPDHQIAQTRAEACFEAIAEREVSSARLIAEGVEGHHDHVKLIALPEYPGGKAGVTHAIAAAARKQVSAQRTLSRLEELGRKGIVPPKHLIEKYAKTSVDAEDAALKVEEAKEAMEL